MDLKDMGQEGVNWVNVAEDRGHLKGCCGYGDEP